MDKFFKTLAILASISEFFTHQVGKQLAQNNKIFSMHTTHQI
jgi:hypothetical protein